MTEVVGPRSLYGKGPGRPLTDFCAGFTVRNFVSLPSGITSRPGAGIITVRAKVLTSLSTPWISIMLVSRCYVYFCLWQGPFEFRTNSEFGTIGMIASWALIMYC